MNFQDRNRVPKHQKTHSKHRKNASEGRKMARERPRRDAPWATEGCHNWACGSHGHPLRYRRGCLRLSQGGLRQPQEPPVTPQGLPAAATAPIVAAAGNSPGTRPIPHRASPRPPRSENSINRGLPPQFQLTPSAPDNSGLQLNASWLPELSSPSKLFSW